MRYDVVVARPEWKLHEGPDGDPEPPPVTIVDVVRDRLIRTVFQPIVSLDTGALVAAEALSRGPVGTPFEDPLAMLMAAEDAGLVAEIDAVCRANALRAADALGWPATVSLFVNAEPRALDVRVLDALASGAGNAIPVTVELTERGVAHDVATLLEAGEAIRRHGLRIALDDVGADPASLALMPLLRPDVVKLDMGLIRDYHTGQVSEIANAVGAYAEESGATIVAEGIETEADVQTALVLGAHLGQGWLYGRPSSELPTIDAVDALTPAVNGLSPALLGDSPYEIVSRHRPVRTSTKRLLLPLSDSVERQSTALPLPPLLLAAFQHVRHFVPSTRARYAELAARLPFVCAIGGEMSSAPVGAVRGAALLADDPLLGEWTVIVLGAHYACALIARDLGDDGPDLDRRFSYLITHDRELVVAAARSLVGRVVAQR